MAVFNFEIKRQSYNIALSNTQDALSAGDIANGKRYLVTAVDLCAQLEANCVIAEMKESYAQQKRKLISLQNAISKGVNPFLNGGASVKASSRSNAQQVSPAPDTVKADDSELRPIQTKYFSESAPETTLADVAGLEDVKKEIRLRVIAPIKRFELFDKYMDEAGCRILLYGPPGCGKSFVAEAIAGELGCAFAVLNAADLLDKYVGEGPKKLVELFKEAEQFENCLIFFDEMDSVFASREDDDSKHTKDILTTFLTCLSGFGANAEKGVKVIIGATNRPWALDSALVRGKRFDTHIYVGLPDRDARMFLIRKAFKKNPALIVQSDITEDMLADMLDGYSCADISSILSKMKTLAFSRALEMSDVGEEKFVPVTKADADEVISHYRNSITKDSLDAFKAFGRGEL